MRRMGCEVRTQHMIIEKGVHCSGKVIGKLNDLICVEQGLLCSDIEILKKMAALFYCGITDIITGAALNTSYSSSFPLFLEGQEEITNDGYGDVDVVLVTVSAQSVLPLLFGDNLEHTSGCINGGLSAQLLRHRKYVGKPGRKKRGSYYARYDQLHNGLLLVFRRQGHYPRHAPFQYQGLAG